MALSLLVASLVGPALHAQSNADGFIFGSISGSAEEVAAATIVARSVATGAERSARPTSDSTYRVSSLPVGEYQVTLQRPGADDQVRTGVLVRLGLGTQVSFALPGAAGNEVILLDAYRVDGVAISPINAAQTEATILLRDTTLARLPMTRDVAGVALLAPGAVRGEAYFDRFNLQRTVSFGGSSPAENAYYINGFNVTNFRNGLGGSTVPYSFYEEFQVKTGGYGVEFGRSTGGVVNATTKRGGNEFHGGIAVHYEPAELRSEDPDVFLASGAPFLVSDEDRTGELSTDIFLSGPLLKNRVFFYGLYNHRRVHQVNLEANAAELSDARDDDPFWAAKLDAILAPDHLLELTVFSDQRDSVEALHEYDYATRQRGPLIGNTHYERGGDNLVVRYTGQVTDAFSISALYGHGTYDLSTYSDNDAHPFIWDVNRNQLGRATNFTTTTSSDRRNAYRLDGRLSLPGHEIHAGVEIERDRSDDAGGFSGGVFWWYQTEAGSDPDMVLEMIQDHAGSFRTNHAAWYLEDSILLLQDRLRVRAGLRSESFENLNQNGERFVRMDGQIAPRLGFSYAFDAEQRSRVFGNVGRYHLPLPAHVNVRKAGGTFWTNTVYMVNSRNADGTPNKGPALGPTTILSDGTVPDYRTQTNLDLDPMYQDEVILGYQTKLARDWTFSVRGIHRDLRSVIEDVGITDALASYAARNAISSYTPDGVSHSVLTNPGEDVRLFWDMNGDGALEQIVLSNELDIHMQPVRRKYVAVELQLEKILSDRWFMQASYTWSQSYGNFEGLTRSDLRQADPGTTATFDAPELQINAGGPLPNDRRHSFKLFGAYQWSERFITGALLTTHSGRPLNALGNPPTLGPAYAGSFFEVPQGSAGRTPWVTNLDLSMTYQATDHLRFGLSVFNVFDSHHATQFWEIRTALTGQPDPWYMRPTRFQTARSVRLSAALEF